jgi:hypothetical protein
LNAKKYRNALNKKGIKRWKLNSEQMVGVQLLQKNIL